MDALTPATTDAITQARIDLAALHRIADKLRWNESVVNHMTCLVPGRTDRYFIIPYGLHWAEVRASDFLVADLDGNIVEGTGEGETSALALHGPLHRRLKQGTVIIHTHQPHIATLTTLKPQRLLWVHQDATMFHGIVSYIDKYGDVPVEASVGAALAEQVGDALVTLMANHGPMVFGHTIAQAFQTLYYLDRIAAVQVGALQCNRELELISDDLAAKMAPITRGTYLGREADLHFAAQKRLLDRAGADYAD